MRKMLAALAALLGTLALLELGAIGLVRAGLLAAPRPHHGRTGFWWHHHPEFGAWHHPGTSGDHNGPCYKARYEINDAGARDVARAERSARRRVVVLGDSFLEGYGVDVDSRLSNMLEAETSVPHLNFAMASFGPYQQLLVYETIARRFDHDAVIVSLFPGNDFADLDPGECATLGDPDYCYRPFLVERAGAFERVDLREPALRRFLRLHSQAWNAVASIRRGRIQAGVAPGSLFYHFTPRDEATLRAVLDRLAAAAEGKTLVILLIPRRVDFEEYAERGADPLSAWLEDWARPHGARVVNLLPGMAAAGRSWDAYTLACDFHWNRYGNRVARDLFLKALPDWPLVPTP